MVESCFRNILTADTVYGNNQSRVLCILTWAHTQQYRRVIESIRPVRVGHFSRVQVVIVRGYIRLDS